MSNIADPLQVVADLEPAMLSQLADDSYARRRTYDLTRAIAGKGVRAQPGHGRRRGSRAAGSRSRLALPVAGAAIAVAVAVAAVLVAARPAGGPAPSPAAALSARGFLLTSAEAASRAPATAGTYWYIRERDFEPTATGSKGLGAAFGASYAETQETWAGPSRVRTIVDEKLSFSFASAADKARWQAAGSPKLASAAGFGYTAPVTSNYRMSTHWGVGKYQLTMRAMQRLPITAPALGRLLHKMWNGQPGKAAALGLPHPTFGQYLVGWADMLLTGPARPGTRAAIYQLLAGQHGITIVDKVTDPLGRAGNAIGDGAGDYLLIDPATAQLLAYTTIPVHPHTQIASTGSIEVYEVIGWTSQFGVPAP
jgi:hypothetical protein